MSKRTIFRDILTEVAPRNIQLLMNRARTANRLAKAVHGGARQNAYSVKTDALVALTNRFPERTLVRTDPFSAQLVIVEVKNAWFGLHAPINHFEARLS